MAPCTHPGIKGLFCLKLENGLIISREVNEARRPHICSRPCAFEEKKKEKRKNTKKSRPTLNTPRNQQQLGDRDHLETARDETRPTRSHMLALSHRSGVCGNRSRTALAISKNDECYMYTDRHTDRLIKRYSSCRYNERQLIDVTVVRRVRPRAERWCDCEGHRRWKRAGRTLFCN